MGLCAFIKRWRHEKWPTVGHLGRGVAACLFIASGCLVYVVFGLMAHPAVDLLSAETRSVMGLLAMIFMASVGFRELRTIFWKKIKPGEEKEE